MMFVSWLAFKPLFFGVRKILNPYSSYRNVIPIMFLWILDVGEENVG
jgi:hypothetical protein